MSTSIRTLRMFLHSPAGDKNLIGYLSRYGDILRASFNEDYVEDAVLRKEKDPTQLRGRV